MLISVLQVLSILSMLAVAGVLFAGLFVMVRNKPGDIKRSNRLMRLRIAGQAIALLCLGLLWATAYMDPS